MADAYKPKIRVGVDWDKDGFIHLDGVAEGATPTLLDLPLYGNAWTYGFKSDWTNNSTFEALVDTPRGILEQSVLLSDGTISAGEARYARLFLRELKQQTSLLPSVLFDGNNLSDVDIRLTGATTQQQNDTEFGEEQFTDTASDTIVHDVTVSLYLGQEGSDTPSLATIDDIAVESGNTYTFSFWTYLTSTSANDTNLRYVNLTVYRDDGTTMVTTGNYGVETPFLKIDRDKWVLNTVEFTSDFTGFISLLTTAYAHFNGTGDLAVTTITTTGFLLHEKVTWEKGSFPTPVPVTSDWVSTQFYANLISDATQFYNSLLANTDYTLGFYVRADVAKTIDYTIRSYEHTTRNTSDTTGTFSVTTSDTLVEIPFSKFASNSYSCVAEFYHASEDTVTLTFSGVTVYPSAESYHVVLSSTAQYDNLQSYLVGSDWQMGKKGYYDSMAFEGTMNIELNNESRIFSPANVDSPLFGSLQQNLKAIVQMFNPNTSTWQTMWAGWTSEFSAKLGTASSRRATIKCKQGLYRLREGTFSYLPQDDKRIGEVIEELVNYSGWRTTVTPLQWWLSNSRQLGVDTFLVAQADVWATLDEGVQTYEMIGDGWNSKTKLDSAIKELLEAEDAVLWVTRDGHLELLTRDKFAYFGETIDSVDIGTLTNAKYVFGKNLINQVEVHVSPKEEVLSTEVWRTKVPIYVPKGGVSEPVLLTFEKEEEGVRTVDNLKLTQDEMTVTVYAIPRKRRKKQGLPALPITSDKILAKVKVSTKTDGNGRIYLTIENDHSKPVYVDVAIEGDYIVGGEGVSFAFEDLDAIGTYDALHKVIINTKICTTFNHAKGLAELRLMRNAYPAGDFSSIEVITQNDTLTEDIATWTLGTFLKLSEEQSGEVNNIHVVIGEKAKVKDGLLYMTYTLARLPNYTFMKFGDTLSDESIFFI